MNNQNNTEYGFIFFLKNAVCVEGYWELHHRQILFEHLFSDLSSIGASFSGAAYDLG